MLSIEWRAIPGSFSFDGKPFRPRITSKDLNAVVMDAFLGQRFSVLQAPKACFLPFLES
jgi:hypothetical protein